MVLRAVWDTFERKAERPGRIEERAGKLDATHAAGSEPHTAV